ncbi:MAG TPA: protein kinase [Terriglobia bacterium]|nr:protein kinase [Terriglobia bacterium]
MRPERWQQIGELYHAALECEAERRADFLGRACGGDDALRRQVEQLLEAHDVAGSFLTEPALEIAARAAVANPTVSTVGRQISHYQILSLLGAGGMGEVYLAQDVRLDRTVALKMLPFHAASDQDRMHRFLREARAASAFNHQNVAAIYDIGECDGRRFIAMEYVQGQTLAAKIGGQAMDPREIVAIGIQVADALSEAHSKGIIHRDIKSANLMLTPRGQVKVLDFGLAKITHAEGPMLESISMGPRTQPGGLMGTVQYMSPEQVLGRDVDHRSDIFSLGVVLYEMAAGRAPFAGASIGETMDRILHMEPEAIPSLAGEGLARIVRKCLEKDQQRRYQSARELWADLRNIEQSAASPAVAIDRVDEQKSRILSLARAKYRWLLAAMLAIVPLFLLLFLNRTAPVMSFSPRDWILVADVDNQTGDPVFDKSLHTAFVVGLEQSRYANILPRSRITESLKRMKKTGTEAIDEALARDIALREGARAVVVASIGAVGDTFQLAVRVQDPAGAGNVWSKQSTVSGKDKVLNAVDGLVAEVRSALGESMPAIAASSKPLAQVTTASMDALMQYSLAIEKHRAANFAEAKTYYENAIRLDPGFTSAKGQLGIVNFEFFNREEGKRLLSEAIRDVDSLTDVEKYGILAFHARAVENDIPKSIQFYKLLLALHPDLSTVRNNLGWFYFQLGRGKEAEAEYKEALRLDPYMMLTYNGLTMVYLFQLGDADAALELIKKQLSYDTRQAFPYQNKGLALLGKDDLDAAEQALKQSLEIDEKAAEARYLLGYTYLLQSRYRDAVEIYLSVPRLDSNEYDAYYLAGLTCQVSADRDCERQNFAKYVEEVNKRIRKTPNDARYQFDLAMAYTRMGQPAKGQTHASAATKLDPANHVRFAQFLSAQGKTKEAVDQLEAAIQNGFRNFIWMKVHPDLQTLRAVPRFRELVKTNLKSTS